MGEDMDSPNISMGHLGASEGPCSGIHAYEQDSGRSTFVLCLKSRKMSVDSEATQNLSISVIPWILRVALSLWIYLIFIEILMPKILGNILAVS